MTVSNVSAKRWSRALTLKESLLKVGYLPENLPPTFTTDALGSFLAAKDGWISRKPVRAANYNTSKRGMTRRTFSLVHPETAHDLAAFIDVHADAFAEFFGRSPFSLSAPRLMEDGDRAVQIASHSELEAARLAKLAPFRFIAKTDISRFYHSIYTHSVPWAFHGKAAAKADRKPTSEATFMNRLDAVLCSGQDGQTIGIPVGPDASRYVAELVGTAIDLEFLARGGAENCEVIRHVDDVWIGAHTHADAEAALWKYREAIRSFELDINESKTLITSEHFQFSDVWPSDISTRIEFAINSPSKRVPDRLRAALEYAFSLAAKDGDDGILKYTLRYLDRSKLADEHWEHIEPFLKRAAVHFGHTVDYVARIVVWRHLARRDLEIAEWTPIIVNLLQRHGRLGNDGEVCWALYVALRLGIPVPLEVAQSIVTNCGALSTVSLLSMAEFGLVDVSIFSFAENAIITESASGSYWPIFLEWQAKDWPEGVFMVPDNPLIEEIAGNKISIFDATQLPAVFDDFDEEDFGSVGHAIEARTSQYDDDDEGEDGEGEGDGLDF